MDAIIDAHSYELTWQSVPPALVTLEVLALSVYVLIMNGAPLLRAAFFVFCGGVAPMMASYALAGSATSPEVAAALYKIGFALAPTAAAAMLVFQVLLSQQLNRYRWLVMAAVVSGLAQAVPILATDWYIQGIWQTSWGFYHFTAGPAHWLLLLGVVGWISAAAYLVWMHIRVETSAVRSKQLRSSMLGFVATVPGFFDVLLSHGIGIYPMSWLFMGLGVGLLLRSIFADDLIQASSVDRRLPLLGAYIVAAGVGIWLVVRMTTEQSTVLLALRFFLVYLAIRILIALIHILRRPSVTLSDTPLERMLAQYAIRVQVLHEEAEIGELTSETISFGLGCERIELLLPSARDWSWETIEGVVLSEDATPDPLTFSWLLDHSFPIQRTDLQGMRLGDFREPIEALFAANRAEVLVPLVNRDEMVGMVLLGDLRRGRSLSREELRFIEKVQEHLTAALVYARMHREANARVAMEKEVELAAAVQSAFVPAGDIIELGSIQLSGLWYNATQCGGDWWSVHHLPDGRVLVLIGDVTGHGVAAAMVTAAAKGCYDVVQRLMGTSLDLVRLLELLDGAVRLVGANRFHMTCFATLLDPQGGTVEFANAGHVVPYLCRPRADGGMDLGALVARGNPLGAGEKPNHRAQTQELCVGDILVWYTDGIVECFDAQQDQFGDRRMQRLLRKLDRIEPDARAIRDHIVRAVAAFQGGRPADDDITLVIARVT